MTKRDKAVFDKAFAKMEAKGCFSKLRGKGKLQAKPTTLKTAKKPRRRVKANSVSSAGTAVKTPLVANKR